MLIRRGFRGKEATVNHQRTASAVSDHCYEPNKGRRKRMKARNPDQVFQDLFPACLWLMLRGNFRVFSRYSEVFSWKFFGDGPSHSGDRLIRIRRRLRMTSMINCGRVLEVLIYSQNVYFIANEKICVSNERPQCAQCSRRGSIAINLKRFCIQLITHLKRSQNQ